MQLSRVNLQRSPHVVLLLILTLLCWFGIAAAQSTKSAPAAKGAKKAAPAKAAPAKGPLSRAELLELMRALSPGAVAAQINSRGLAFEPETEDVAWLLEQIAKPPGEWAAVINALNGLKAAPISAEAAQGQIEEALVAISKAPPTSLEILENLHPLLIEEKGKVTAVFDPQRYRKHTVGKARALPGSSRVAAALFVFTVDGIEKLHFAQFTPTKAGKLLLRDLSESNAKDATFHLGAELDLAETRLREIYRSDFDNISKVAQNVMTPALIQSLEEIGGWRRIVRGQRVPQETLRIEPIATIDMRSIRPVLKVSHAAGNRTVTYFADFERIGDDLRIVRLRDASGGRDIGADPELDLYLCRRYETSGCDLYTKNPTEMPDYANLARLQSMAEAAMQDFQGERLKEVAGEMRVSFVGDEDPRGLAFLASATFLDMKYPEAEQLAQQAIAKGATVYLPVLHFFIPKLGEPWFGRAMLGISKAGLEYVPSADISQYPRYTVPWKDVLKIEVGPKVGGLGPLGKPHPFLRVEANLPRQNDPSKTSKESWNFAIFPTGCAAAGSQVRDDMAPWSVNPCKNTPSVYQYGDSPSKGKVAVPMAPIQSGGFPIGGQTQVTTMLMAHKTWQQAAVTLQRLILTVKGGT